MHRLLIFQIMMALTAVCGLLVAQWLGRHATKQKGLKPLAGFNLLMALWCTGHLLLSLDWPQTGQVLLSLNPLMPTLFLHFALQLIADRVNSASIIQRLEALMPWCYGLSLLVVILSITFSHNRVEPWLDFPWFLILGDIGWLNLIYTILLGLCGHTVLLWGYLNSSGNTRRTIMLLFAAGAWGFTLATSYISASLGWNYYPYLLWLLPSYLLLLTYAVLRYQLLEVNYWAIKTIIWAVALLLLLGVTTLLTSMASQLGFTQLAGLPLSILWLYSIVSGLMLWLLYQPLQRLASRLVYPDVTLTQGLIDHWLTELEACQSYAELAQVAGGLISTHIQQPVVVTINQPQSSLQLQIQCQQQQQNWQFELKNWQDVTPGIRHVGEVFAPLVYTSCINLDKSLRLAQQESERQQALRLVELGTLTAAMAHEIRNPLNIISMASAQTEDKVKQHIQQQLKRADTLIQDLLSYAKVIVLDCKEISLSPLLNALANSAGLQHQVEIDIECPEQLTIYADVYKLQQVLVNLLDNAATFAATSTTATPKVLVQCESNSSGSTITVHNNGPAIDADFQPQLFKPFISKRPGGSGLGLAIVHRIITAHQGKINHSDQLGWPVSFSCKFPHSNQLVSGNNHE